ncbi:hypothetical protein F3Y22_tig00010533pilonHSYRG00011 [Hibiscus syriacus]|uniref:Reverse transcriptase zinc-binding domain-containing protein n=1 Tax=Hibiscus syriacus TaxID=106335 RepID=A0A6A3C4W3_HIBSY|nr:hypothetical protein F3Y22_tig00010533pilonHSYRG00011 [Hibiscus syriacus]
MLIDGKRVSVGIAKYKKGRKRATEENKVQLEGFMSVRGDNGRQQVELENPRSLKDGRQQVELEKQRSLRDGRTYKKVLNVENRSMMVKEILENRGGVIKDHLQHAKVMKALAKEGFEVKIVKWGYVRNASIIVFNSKEDLEKAWSSFHEKLSFWFDWLAPMLNEEGVPLAYCLVDLVGLPLLSWNEPFLEKLAGRLGKFVNILEKTRNIEDLSSATVLLRVASPFDVPEFITMGSYGRSFKVKVNLDLSCNVSADANGIELENYSNNGYSVDFSKEDEGGDAEKEENNRGISTEGIWSKLGTCLHKSQESGKMVESGEHALEKKSLTHPNINGMSDNFEFELSPNRDYTGLGLREVVDQSCSAHSDSNWESYSPVTKLISAGPAVKLKWDGTKFHSKVQSPLESNENERCIVIEDIIEGVQANQINVLGKQVEGKLIQEENSEFNVKSAKKWKLRFPVSKCLSIRSALDGRRGKTSYARVYRRTRNRRIWLNSDTFMAPLMRGEYSESVAAASSITSGSRKEYRRKKKGLITEAIDWVNIYTASSFTFSKLLEEALATWGLGRSEKTVAVARQVRKLKPVFLFIQESKLEQVHVSITRRIGGNLLKGVLVSPAQGSSGGLITMWNESVVQVIYQHVHSRFLAVVGKLMNGQMEFVFINVYGSSIESEKEEFYGELLQFVMSQNFPVCIGGDFNAYIDMEEKQGKSQNWNSINILRSFVQQANLIDLPLSGGAYTWCNNRESSTWVRLDRFLICARFFNSFPNVTQSLLSKSISDHNPVLLEDAFINWGPKPFRKSQGEILSSGEWDQLLEFKIELWRLLRIEERTWFQKSRTRWIKDGDRNTRFFHLSFEFDFKQLTAVQRDCLEAQILEQEVWQAIASSESSKAPGPDGFTMGFYKNHTEFAFIPGRQLLDCACLANEGIDYWKKQGLKGVVSKVDFSRSYDSVDWQIILRLLNDMGFDDRWVSWISQCISTASISVLVNGSPTEEFNIAKGLQQGCSLFCLLFNVIPSSICQKLNSMMATFLWGGGNEKKKLHWVGWKKICIPISGGGLLDLEGFTKDDSIGGCLRSQAKLQVGNGISISFWNDVWSGDLPLKVFSPRIYALSSNKMGNVADFGSFDSNGWEWNIKTRRNLCDWEGDQLVELMDLLKDIKLIDSVEDCLLWGDAVPPRVEAFLWQVSHKKSCSESGIEEKGVPIEDDFLCPLCNSCEESVQHLFIACQLIPGAVLWSIWKIRNEIIFEKFKLDRFTLFFTVRFRLTKWFLAKFSNFSTHVDCLIGDPSLADDISVFKELNTPKVCWTPPPIDFYKMNVDGAVSRTGMSAVIGGIMRDWNRYEIISFSQNVGLNHISLAELKTIKKGIEIFVASVWVSKGRLIVESDSKQAVDWILDQATVPTFLSQFVKDLMFYEGTIKSCDPIKKKHVILYDDGDVEVLRLERERWEHIGTDRKSGKKENSAKVSKSPLKEASPGQKSRSSGGPCLNKSSVKTPKGKRTAKKNLKHTLKSTLKEDEENTGCITEICGINESGADTEMIVENVMEREESWKEVASVSQGRCWEDTKGSPNNAKESDEVKSDADGNHSGHIDSTSENAQKVDEEEKAADGLSEDYREHATKATGSETKENQESDQVGSKSPILKKSLEGPPLTSDVADYGISDDEPLSKWKHKVGKLGSKKLQ